MSAPAVPFTGEPVLAAVTEAMVASHERYHHRKPATAKSLMLGDDLLACVLSGVYTDVEKTMIELQKKTIVQETRNAFQNAMKDRFINAVQDLTGRSVLAFISTTTSAPTSRSSCSSSRPIRTPYTTRPRTERWRPSPPTTPRSPTPSRQPRSPRPGSPDGHRSPRLPLNPDNRAPCAPTKRILTQVPATPSHA
jgi:uncharacterized protein YbcI